MENSWVSGPKHVAMFGYPKLKSCRAEVPKVCNNQVPEYEAGSGQVLREFVKFEYSNVESEVRNFGYL